MCKKTTSVHPAGQSLTTGRRRGFSLVLSLSVMAMLLLLCVGASALLTIQLRVANSSSGYARARLNALVGARIAIGELQRLVGPDRRSTATADILTRSDFTVSADGTCSPGPLEAAYYKGANGDIIRHPRWVGVWNSGKVVNESSLPDVPGVAPGEEGKVVQRTSEGYLADARFLSGADWAVDRANPQPSLQTHRFLGWLVSGNEARPAWDSTAGDDGLVTPYSAIDSVRDTVLLGVGMLGDHFKPSDTTSDMLGARARLVPIRAESSAVLGEYAYWVSDEGVKAKLNIVDRMPPGTPNVGSPNGAYRRLLTTQRNRFVGLKGVDGVSRLDAVDSLPAATLGRIGSLNEINLAMGAPATSVLDISSNYFHDLSFVSRGVLADSVNGGLKRDLTAYLDLNPSETAAKGDYPGVAGTDSILSGPNFTAFSPNYSYLKNWISSAPMLAGTSGSTVYPQSSAAGLYSGMPYRSPDYTNQPAPPRMPVLTQMQYYLSGAKWASPQGPKAGYAIAPVVTLWNPYPVALPVTGLSAHVIYSGNFNGRIKYKDAAGAAQALNLSFGGYGAGPMTKFNLPDMTLAPGESVTLGAPVGVKEMTKPNYSPFSTPVSQGTLEPISSSSGFFFVTKATGAQAADIAGDPTANWNENSGGQGFANLNGSTQQMLLLNGNTAIRQAMFEGWSHSNGYARTYFQWLFSGMPNARLINLPADTAYALTQPNSQYYSVGFRMMCVDEPKAKAMQKNRNFNVFTQWNFNAPKFTRHPFDAVSAQRSSNTANGGLFAFESDANLYSASHTSPLLFNSNTAPTAMSPVDVPRKDLGVYSLAQLQHCPMSQLSWQPALAVGNAFAQQLSPSNQTALGVVSEKAAWKAGLFTNLAGLPEFQSNFTAAKAKTKNGSPLYLFDLSYELNKDLFDSWHVSGVGFNNTATAGVAWAAGETWLPSEKNCPNSRYVSTGKTHDCPSPLYASAAGMLVDGAFNINSTSRAAWASLLSSARGVSVPTGSGDVAMSGKTPFPHHAHPIGNEVATAATTAYDEATWSGVRALSDAEIQVLAAYMVQTVKERGPFLGLSDFVNRRLKPGLDQTPAAYWDFVGAIQAAIDKSTRKNRLINYGLEAPDNTAIARASSAKAVPLTAAAVGGTAYTDPVTGAAIAGAMTDSNKIGHCLSVIPYAENRVVNKAVGAPGYLTQADVLQHVGPALAARSDTFTVRAVGTDALTGASAVVEIVVQRTPDAMFPLNRAANGRCIPDPLKPAFGRRLVIAQTRWVPENEI